MKYKYSGCQSTHPLSSLSASRHLKTYKIFLLMPLRQSPVQRSWTQQLILIHLLKLCLALPPCLQRATWQSLCNTWPRLRNTQSTAVSFTVIWSKHLQSPSELQGGSSPYLLSAKGAGTLSRKLQAKYSWGKIFSILPAEVVLIWARFPWRSLRQ